MLIVEQSPNCRIFFFFNDTATTEIYTLSLHDALPISPLERVGRMGDGWVVAGLAPERVAQARIIVADAARRAGRDPQRRSEEHTSELQSQSNLVCRLLLEKKNKFLTHTPFFPCQLVSL